MSSTSEVNEVKGIRVFPAQLKFVFEPRRELVTTMSLYNPTRKRLAFKVKTTSPDTYCVRPCCGFVEADGSVDVKVIMQAFEETPDEFYSCNDKFLVQSTAVSSSATEVASAMFDSSRESRIAESRITVGIEFLNSDPNPLILGRFLDSGESSEQRQDCQESEDTATTQPVPDSAHGRGGKVHHQEKRAQQKFASVEESFAKVAREVLEGHLNKVMYEREDLRRRIGELEARHSQDTVAAGGAQIVRSRELAGWSEARAVGRGRGSLRDRVKNETVTMKVWHVVALTVGSFFFGRVTR